MSRASTIYAKDDPDCLSFQTEGGRRFEAYLHAAAVVSGGDGKPLRLAAQRRHVFSIEQPVTDDRRHPQPAYL